MPAPDPLPAACSRLNIVVFPLITADLARFADPQVTGFAAEHLADDFQVIQADSDRLPRPPVRHLPRPGHQAGIADHPRQLPRLPHLALPPAPPQRPPPPASP